MSNPMYESTGEIVPGTSGASLESDHSHEPYLSGTGNRKQQNSEIDVDYENVIEKRKDQRY